MNRENPDRCCVRSDAESNARRLQHLPGPASLIVIAMLAACSAPVHAQQHSQVPPAVTAVTPAGDGASDLVKRGEYLTRAADCQPCHTIPGGKPFAGGRAFKIPGGTLYTPNITPDPETGIGKWTDDEFVRALREGLNEHGNYMYPAFPYTSYTKMTRDDALAIKAYLFSLAPVNQKKPANDVSWPFSMRSAIGLWNALFFDKGDFKPDASKPEEWNRGKYLVEALGHCGECHTPRNVFMATKDSKPLAGGTAEGWTAYNITSDEVSGLGGWKDEEIVAYLKTGIAHGKAWANGPMGEAVDDSLKYLNDADLKAIVTYLRTVPAVRGDESKPRYGWSADGRLDEASDSEGARLYTFYCSGCHGADGKTHNEYYPAMVGQGTVGANPPSNLIMIILHGARRADHPYAFMPSYRDAFNDEQVAALVNYVTKRFGDPKASVKAGDVADARKQP
jgi:mono/diheme cytochrome c family protein